MLLWLWLMLWSPSSGIEVFDGGRRVAAARMRASRFAVPRHTGLMGWWLPWLLLLLRRGMEPGGGGHFARESGGQLFGRQKRRRRRSRKQTLHTPTVLLVQIHQLSLQRLMWWWLLLRMTSLRVFCRSEFDFESFLGVGIRSWHRFKHGMHQSRQILRQRRN